MSIKFRKSSILLVEDNEVDIVLTLDAFEESQLEHDITVVRDGKEAIDYLFQKGTYKNATKPDLILLDINLPYHSGFEILEKIKQNEHLKTIPVIMLTTSENPKDIQEAYRHHCNTYIKKPIDMEEFLGIILKIDEFWLSISRLPA